LATKNKISLGKKKKKKKRGVKKKKTKKKKKKKNIKKKKKKKKNFLKKKKKKKNKGCVTTVALPFTLKRYLKAKEELWKYKYFPMQKNIIFKKKFFLRETKILQDIIIITL